MLSIKITYKLIFSISILIFSFACQEESVECTMEWRALSIRIVDTSNNPVFLDDYYTINNSTREIFRMKDIDPYIDSVNKISGEYLVITDSQKHWTKNEYCKVTFIGLIKDKEVVSEEYVVTANVCHIGDLIGRTKIVLNQ